MNNFSKVMQETFPEKGSDRKNAIEQKVAQQLERQKLQNSKIEVRRMLRVAKEGNNGSEIEKLQKQLDDVNAMLEQCDV